ncbi:MAG: hypothetical protein ACOCZ3_04350 [Bacillota bacterium]
MYRIKHYRNTGRVIALLTLIMVFMPVFRALGAQAPHAKPEMVYRVRVVNDSRFMENKFSGIKVENIDLPDYEEITIDNDPWSYILIYLGLESFYVYEGQLRSNMVEAGISIRGTEVHNTGEQGWHPFYNYYPKKKFKPFNDPEAWRGEALDMTEDITLALKVGEVEEIENSHRWNIHYYVNGEEVFVGPMYGNPGSPAQFDAKMSVGAYMASGDEHEIAYEPFRTGDLQVTTSQGLEKEWETISLDDFGIPHHRIGYGEEVNNTSSRSFNTDFENEDYSYAVGLEPAAKDRSGLIMFALFAGLGWMALN